MSQVMYKFQDSEVLRKYIMSLITYKLSLYTIPTPLSNSYARRLRPAPREEGRKEGEGVGETGRVAVTVAVARGKRTG